MPLTVRELIVELKKMPQDKRLEMDTASDWAHIDVDKVYVQGDVVVISCAEADEDYDEEDEE